MSASEPAAGERAAVVVDWPTPGIARAVMTRGAQMNTLTLELIEGLDEAFTEAEEGAARALILTGSGRSFCCGAHVDYFIESDPRIGTSRFDIRDNYLARIAELFDRIERLSMPVIAVMNGHALGGGFELAISCDFRLLSTEALIGLPETRIGALPGAGGVQKLQRLVGRGRAMEWIILGSHIAPEEAKASGLVTTIHAPADLDAAAMALARRIEELAPRAIAQSKAAVHLCAEADLATARRIGLEALAMLVGGDEWNEGMRAFKEKRKPKFASAG